jgi:hypothetical protein
MTKVVGADPGPSNLAFYKKFHKENNPLPALGSKGELNCKDLLELFW